MTVEDLSCVRGGRVVFSGLSFQASAGTPTLLRGPNGVGKSTLLRVLAGLLPAASGSAQLGEARLANRSAFQELVTYAGHLDAVKPALTIRQNLAIWAGIHGTGPAEVDAALGRFGLDHIADRPTVQCSAGQKRRLGLARLMVIDRPLWLLDEPTVSLDADSSRLVAHLIREHCARGGLALVATHVDLGIEDACVLTLQPPREIAQGAVSDAFLEGDWA